MQRGNEVPLYPKMISLPKKSVFFFKKVNDLKIGVEITRYFIIFIYFQSYIRLSILENNALNHQKEQTNNYVPPLQNRA